MFSYAAPTNKLLLESAKVIILQIQMIILQAKK